MKKCDVKGCKNKASVFSLKESLCEEHHYQQLEQKRKANLMRSLTIKYLKPTEPQPRATLTFAEKIPDSIINKLWMWLQDENGEFGRAKDKVTVNVIMKDKTEGEEKE